MELDVLPEQTAVIMMHQKPQVVLLTPTLEEVEEALQAEEVEELAHSMCAQTNGNALHGELARILGKGELAILSKSSSIPK